MDCIPVAVSNGNARVLGEQQGEYYMGILLERVYDEEIKAVRLYDPVWSMYVDEYADYIEEDLDSRGRWGITTKE